MSKNTKKNAAKAVADEKKNQVPHETQGTEAAPGDMGNGGSINESDNEPKVQNPQAEPDDLKDDPDAGEDIAEDATELDDTEGPDEGDDLPEDETGAGLDDVAFEVGQVWVNPEDLTMTIDAIAEDGKVDYTTEEGEKGVTTLQQLEEWLELQAITLQKKDEAEPESAESKNASDDPEKARPPESLYGSSIQPHEFVLKGGSRLPLGDIVRSAHESSGLSVEEWNALEEPAREEFIADIVAALDLEDGTNDFPQPDADEIERLRQLYGAESAELTSEPGEETTIVLLDAGTEEAEPTEITSGTLLQLWADLPLKDSAEIAAATEALESPTRVFTRFTRRKPVRVLQDGFEYDGKVYNKGDLFDWANLNVKVYAVQRLYQNKVLGHTREDRGVLYPLRPNQDVQRKVMEARAELESRKNTPPVSKPAESVKQAETKKEPAAGTKKFTMKNAHINA